MGQKFKIGDVVRPLRGFTDEEFPELGWREDMESLVGEELTVTDASRVDVYAEKDGHRAWWPNEVLELAKKPVEEVDTGSAATSKHYNAQQIQPIQICQMVLTTEEFAGAMKFNIMKYTQRAGTKEGESSEKDWNKAKQYKYWLELAEQGVKIDPRVHVI